MKIAFYLDNSSYQYTDLSKPFKGNPGLGGTEYMIWTISSYLDQLYKEVSISLLAPIVDNLPQNIDVLKCNSLKEAIIIASDNKFDILIFRGPMIDFKMCELLNKKKIKSIIWNHNYENAESLKLISECDYIVRNVCVSKEQYDRLRDHKVFVKSTYIYNGLDFGLYDKARLPLEKKKNVVCYMGSLVQDKGFHILAKCWPRIKSKVPDAELHIIGSGKLYNADATLGYYNIAEKEYESQFIEYLLDSNKCIDSSVNFHGVLSGEDKLKRLSQAKVGIANPTGVGETFCIVAVEFQAVGVPVVSRKIHGLLDTIDNGKTGLLISDENGLIDSVVKLLLNDEHNNKLGAQGYEFVRKKFDIFEICSNWYNMLTDVVENKPVVCEYTATNYLNDIKWAREINRNIKIIFPRAYSIIDWRAKVNLLINKLRTYK